MNFDYICCSVGTGGTISGLINSTQLNQKVIGFSALKGDFLQKDIRKFATNKNWILNVSTLTPTFMAIGPDASNQMPPSILSLKKNSSSTFLPLTNSPSMITLGYRGDLTTSGNDFKMDIKATPGYSFDGGAYAIVLLFTLSAQ